MLKRIDRILIRVPSVAGAVTYYRDVLGMKLIREDARLAALRMSDDSAEFVLHADHDLPEQAIYLLVDSVRDIYKRRTSLKLDFLSPPAQTARGFTATVKDPFGTVLQLLDRSAESSAKHEDGKPAGEMLFAGVETKTAPKRELLIKIYEKIGRTADDLPYTPHFEQLYEPYIAQHPEPKPGRAEVWRHLLNLRKGGKLPKLGEARSKPPALPGEDRERLRAILAGDIGKRDRLPYTKRFDELVDSFNKTLERPLSPHLIWRAVATLAK
jgi:catechol 2,3-dioxygenase-like lactoylglutathione lyase family enzyme